MSKVPAVRLLDWRRSTVMFLILVGLAIWWNRRWLLRLPKALFCFLCGQICGAPARRPATPGRGGPQPSGPGPTGPTASP